MQTVQLRSSASFDSDTDSQSSRATWIDMDVADREGQDWLADQSGLSDEIIERLTESSPSSQWRRIASGVHLNVLTVVPSGDDSQLAIADFGIWLEPNRIITVRRTRVPALESAAGACANGTGPSSPLELIVFVLADGLHRLEENLQELTTTVDRLEDEVLDGDGDPPIDRIAELQKRLIYARRFRMPVASLVGFISSLPHSAIDDALREEVDGMATAVSHNQDLLGLSIDRATALQGQIRDQLADSMNTATYRFTWVATVFLPLSFLTGLLGINVAGIPGDHNPLAFWLVCGALLLIAAIWATAVGRVTQPFGRRKSKKTARR